MTEPGQNNGASREGAEVRNPRMRNHLSWMASGYQAVARWRQNQLCLAWFLQQLLCLRLTIPSLGGIAFAGPLTIICLFGPACTGRAAENKIGFGEQFPSPIYEEEPGFVELYWQAVTLARQHVQLIAGMPCERFMDEAFRDDTIWIWDTCFMVEFCRYAPTQLPGIESLSNFYAPIHDGFPLPQFKGAEVKIQHPDNPPLFAWAEWEYFRITGDLNRVRWLLEEKKYLQKHFAWFVSLKPGVTFQWARSRVTLSPQEVGFLWRGVSSGMDNSPRFQEPILCLDALSQQGLAARCISKMASAIGDQALEQEFHREYERIAALINTKYWDDADGFYYDLNATDGTFSKVRTPASFWPVLAGMASPEKAARMANYVRSGVSLGGLVPWPSVARDNPNYEAKGGNYWRGAVWIPTAYVGIRALSENGEEKLADETAEALLRHVYRTYKEYVPHTIWECYDPEQPQPALHDGKIVRPDFCGWSALAPISLFIENVIGFHFIDASTLTVRWRLHHNFRHGIDRLTFGPVTASIVTDGRGMVEVSTDHAFTLVVNEKSIHVSPGRHSFSVSQQ